VSGKIALDKTKDFAICLSDKHMSGSEEVSNFKVRLAQTKKFCRAGAASVLLLEQEPEPHQNV
jgi:hypothetical protein